MNDADALRILRQIRLLAFVITILLFITVLCNIHAILPWQRPTATAESFEDAASRLMGAGRYSEVVALAETQKNANPRDPYAWWYLGVGRYSLGSWEAAIEAFNKVEELAPLWEQRACAYIVRAQTFLSDTNQEAADKRR